MVFTKRNADKTSKFAPLRAASEKRETAEGRGLTNRGKLRK